MPAWHLHYLTNYGARDEHIKYVSELYKSTNVDKITRGTTMNNMRLELTGITIDSCGVKVEILKCH